MAAEDAAVVVTLRANLKDYEAALKSAVRSTERAAKAAETAISGVGKGGGASNVIAVNFQKSAGQIANDARVLQYQLNDIFSGVASGQGIRAVQMQLGQIAQQLGGQGLGAAARTMGAALVGMINPVNLAVVAFGALATVAASYFTASGKDTEKVNRALEAHIADLRKVAEAYKSIFPALDAYVTKQEKLIEVAKQLTTVLAEQEVQKKKIDAAYGDVNAGDALADLYIQIQQNAGAAAETLQNELLAALTAFQQAQSEGKGVQEAWNALVAKATDLEKRFGDGGTATADKLGELGAAIGTNVKALEDFTKAGETIPTVVLDLKELTAALEGLVGVDPTGLLAIIDMLRKQFPDALGAAGGALSSFGSSIGTMWDEVGTQIKTASDLLKKEEGFRPSAYKDWNTSHTDWKWRAGFGSDTFVNEMGKVQDVTEDTVVTLEQANADLTRRIGEFQSTIVSQIGPDFWRSLSEGQQAALTSIAYNYGSLPPAIVKALKAGDQGQVATAIANLSANPERRQREAQLFAGGSGRAGDALDAADEAAKATEKEAEARATATQNLAEYLEKLDEQATLEQRIADIKMSGMSAEDQQRAIAVETELQTALNQAKQDGITLSDQEIERIRAATLARTEAKIAGDTYVQSQKDAAQALQQMNQQMAGMIGGAVSGFVQDLMAGKDAGEAFANMLQRITSQLVDMVVQMLIVKPLMTALGGIGGGGVGLVGAAATGGIVGQTAFQQRQVSPLVFAGAPRFAKGGMVGLRAGEVPIIAHRGEVIIPKDMVGRSGATGGGDTNITDNSRIRIDMGTGIVAADTASAKVFGENVKKIIQQEMVREARPGGLLRRVPS